LFLKSKLAIKAWRALAEDPLMPQLEARLFNATGALAKREQFMKAMLVIPIKVNAKINVRLRIECLSAKKRLNLRRFKTNYQKKLNRIMFLADLAAMIKKSRVAILVLALAVSARAETLKPSVPQGTASNPIPTISVQVPSEKQLLLKKDLSQMGALEGSGAGTPLFNEYFGGNYDGGTMTRFLNSRVENFNYDSCDDEEESIPACTIPGLGSRIFISGGYNNQLSQLYRMSTLLHEARHIEAKKFNYHSICGNDPEVLSRLTGKSMTGKPACDSSADGAYGLQIEFLGNTALYCKNCSDEMRKEANQLARELLARISNAKERQKLKQDLKL
jgi:hypothetical protein